MKKLIALMIVALAALLLTSAQAGIDLDGVVQAARRQAMAEWIKDNAQETLSDELATQIVDDATFRANEHGLDPLLVLAVIRTESGFRPHAQGRGSKGLMQVQVYWHRDKLRGRSPFNPLVSIEVGTQILADCWSKTPGNVARVLRCYNGGGDRNYYAKVEAQRRTLARYTRQAVFDQFMLHAASYQPPAEVGQLHASD